MKKMIAILATFALIGGAAFAQPSIGGGFDVATRLLTGSTADNADDVTAGGTFMNNSHINVSFGDAEAGGFMRIYHRGQNGTNAGVGNNTVPFAFMWWKPIEQIRIQLGENPDADWGHAQISGWGYTGEAQNGVALDEWAGTNNLFAGAARNTNGPSGGILRNVWSTTPRAFAPGFSALGLALTISPIENLDINIGVPLAHVDNNNDTRTYLGSKAAKDVYGASLIDVAYKIEEVGTLRVAAQLNGFETNDDLSPVNLNLAFHLTSIQSLGLEFGLGYRTEQPSGDANPISIGFGLLYADGDFGIKARGAVSLAGENEATIIGIGILPFYNLSSNIVGYFNAGFGVAIPKVGDSQTDWFINPYIMVRAANGVRFYAGLKVVGYSDAAGNGDGTIDWAIPILIRAYF